MIPASLVISVCILLLVLEAIEYLLSKHDNPTILTIGECIWALRVAVTIALTVILAAEVSG